MATHIRCGRSWFGFKNPTTPSAVASLRPDNVDLTLGSTIPLFNLSLEMRDWGGLKWSHTEREREPIRAVNEVITSPPL